MSAKRPSLAETMRQAVQSEPPAAPPQIAAAPSVVAPPLSAPIAAEAAPKDTKAVGFYAATRAGKKKVTAALSPAMHKQLRGLALSRDTTTEALLLEAIADLFAKHRVL